MIWWKFIDQVQGAKMQIPKRFKLLGHSIDVREDFNMFFEKQSYGECCFEGKWIKMVFPSEHHPITQTSLEHTFIHELVHMCLYYTEQGRLNDNEGFVDTLAGLLHQALTTMEFSD
jgi:hypothetical protein